MKTLIQNRTFIDPQEIFSQLQENIDPARDQIKDIISKALSIETLSPKEVACLVNLKDEDLWNEIYDVALKIKKKVYDNRIVTFAPLYCSNYCVNNCVYCGFRKSNKKIVRKKLSIDEIKKEVEILAGEIGHKRLIVVFGEDNIHSNIDYITEVLETIYSVKVKTKNSYSSIRRINVNCAPLSVEELKILKQKGIGTYQVFQETYNPQIYYKLHPKNTPKSDYEYRLYCMHRAFEAGIEDVGIGFLLGLYDWRFEVISLVCHAIELEKRYGIGPHTVSFPRLEPAYNTNFINKTKYKVSDQDLKKIISIIRLSIPYTGLILTAREPKQIRDECVEVGVTQMDASSKIAIGSYYQKDTNQQPEMQQFLLKDNRTLDELVKDLAKRGYITSFCTAGYRCGRTGDKIINLLKCGKEAIFCKLNAILTFKEYLDDFASYETKKYGVNLINKEIQEVKQKFPKLYDLLLNCYQRIEQGERDIYL